MSNRLLEAIQQDRAPHAILISGPEGSGRRELARRCAALFCLGEDAPERLINCPNYYEIGESAVKVDDIRTLLSSAAMQGFNGGQRAFVFVNAQLMSTQIQNTLLKTLEEPHSETMLILTGNEFGLLPTIRSRCVTLRIGGEKRVLRDELAAEYLLLAAKRERLGLCLLMGKCDDWDAERLGSFLESLRAALADALCGRSAVSGLTGEKAVSLLALCDRAEEYRRLNVGTKHIMGMLCALK